MNFLNLSEKAELRKNRPESSVIVPTYNSSKFIRQFVVDLLQLLREAYREREFQIILVDDASTDDTKEELNRLQLEFAELIVLRPDKNLGQQRAIFFGLTQAEGSEVLILDDDWLPAKNDLENLINFSKSSEGTQIVGKRSSIVKNRKTTSGIFWAIFKKITNQENLVPELTLRIIPWGPSVRDTWRETPSLMQSCLIAFGPPKYLEITNCKSYTKKSRQGLISRIDLFIRIVAHETRYFGIKMMVTGLLTIGVLPVIIFVAYLLKIITFNSPEFVVIGVMIWLTWALNIFIAGVTLALMSRADSHSGSTSALKNQ